MTTPQPTTGKAIAADPDVFLAWSFLIKRGTLRDHGLRFSPELTEQLDDGRHVYTFDPALADAVEADFVYVADTYTGTVRDPLPALWTPN